jgi:hypothetical protein
MKHILLLVFIVLPILQCALSAPAFAQAEVVIGGGRDETVYYVGVGEAF